MAKKLFSALLAALALLASCAAAEEVERGMVLGEIMRELDLPLKTGKSFGDVDETTPYHSEVESALSLGILYPSDDFSPEIACANAEALMFALQAMGFRHEAETTAWALPNPDKKLPSYISGYVSLARALVPAAPESVSKDPWGSTTTAQLREILRWLRKCRASVVWDCAIRRPEGTLRIHRENIGRPPEGWRVQLGVFDVEENARAFADKLDAGDCPIIVVDREHDYAVATPRIADRSLAHAIAEKLRKLGALIRPDSGESGALFWTSFTPASPADAVIRMNKAHDAKALGKLSDIASANGAICAVNGGYFSSSGAIGTLFSDGLPASLPYHNRSMAAWDGKGNMFFGGGEFISRLSVNGGAPVDIILNGIADMDTPAVLTPAFGLARRAGNNGYVARIRGGKAVEAAKALVFKRDMGPDEWFVVSRNPSMAPQLGDSVSLVTRWREKIPFDVETAVQAGPLIYAPGRTMRGEMLSESILKRRHPRTLIGSDGKNMVWIVADGRSAWHSRGLTLTEAAALGRKRGLKYLLNLDGGGSSEMWWNGHIVNDVSDGRERKMPYGLMVLEK